MAKTWRSVINTKKKKEKKKSRINIMMRQLKSKTGEDMKEDDKDIIPLSYSGCFKPQDSEKTYR